MIKSALARRKRLHFWSDRSEGTISIEGSSSVAPIMEKLIAGYASYNPKATITMKTTDSSDGLNAAIRGDCDLAMSSRALKDYEKELLAYGGDWIGCYCNRAAKEQSNHRLIDQTNPRYLQWKISKMV